MTEFIRIQGASRQEVIDEFFKAAREAEATREIEREAALTIQTIYRGWSRRKDLNQKRRAAINIQRVMRGYIARKGYEEALRDKEKRERMAFFNHCATLIQKVWRGYYSRKHIHDYYKRKAYLQLVTEKGERLRENSRIQYEKYLETEQQIHQAEMEAKFKEESGRLHFLISTKTIPGVLSHSRIMTLVNDLPIEHHLHANRKLGKMLEAGKNKNNVNNPGSPSLPPIIPPRNKSCTDSSPPPPNRNVNMSPIPVTSFPVLGSPTKTKSRVYG